MPPSSIEVIAAREICHGVSKSGSPTPSETTPFDFATTSKNLRIPLRGKTATWGAILAFSLLIELSQKNQLVVSCGGGAALREINVQHMKNNGRVVLLTAAPETILERVKDNDDRPLLRGNKNVEFIGDLMEKRRAKYEAAADIVISTDHKSVLEICQEMIGKLMSWSH